MGAFVCRGGVWVHLCVGEVYGCICVWGRCMGAFAATSEDFLFHFRLTLRSLSLLCLASK